jgi:histidinol dehydrogenase
MRVFRYPEKKDWSAILQRPVFETRSLEEKVSAILEDVKRSGDAALRRYTKQFDESDIETFLVSDGEFAEAEKNISDELKDAIRHAKSNIEKFHAAQKESVTKIETTKGVLCWRKSVAIEKVGLYVPAGTAPLFSTVLMLGIPAMIAGCKEIVLCSPPDERGKISDAILYAANTVSINKVFKAGGVQAIGAMAFGTESIPKVHKIFGPGNQFVTCAKQLVAQQGVGIDMPAGPSEVAVLADETCVTSFVAADLLSQAEHGTDSQVLLVSTCEKIIDEVMCEIENQIKELPRREIAKASFENSKAILTKTVDEAIELLNEYATEHLILACENADEIAEKITNAGSVFIGNYSCESAGDYASGTNHVLPTNGFAKSFSGISLDSFVKKITFQKLSSEGMVNLGETIEVMATAEKLDAHKNAISIRLKAIEKNA